MPDPISWSLSGPYLLAALVAGYLLGSVPFGIVLTRLAGYGDLRKMGSGNIGATNVLRTGRKDLAAATLVLDAGKGAAAVLAAGWLYGPDVALMAAYGAILGHLFPVWLKFRGGKGVATTLGVHIAIAWPMGLACCGVWLVTAALTRYSSLSALIAMAAAPAFAWYLVHDLQLVQFSAVVAVIVWVKHRENIRRLVKGEESKIGQKGKRKA
jgi:glycerol-3-phosphate acyltransferase PlsY